MTVTQWLDRWLNIIKAEVAAQTWIGWGLSGEGLTSPRLAISYSPGYHPGDLQAFYGALGGALRTRYFVGQFRS